MKILIKQIKVILPTYFKNFGTPVCPTCVNNNIIENNNLLRNQRNRGTGRMKVRLGHWFNIAYFFSLVRGTGEPMITQWWRLMNPVQSTALGHCTRLVRYRRLRIFSLGNINISKDARKTSILIWQLTMTHRFDSDLSPWQCHVSLSLFRGVVFVNPCDIIFSK